jgi:hypothetical protein
MRTLKYILNGIKDYHLIAFLFLSGIAIQFSFTDTGYNPSGKEISHWYRGNTHTHAKFSDKNNIDDVPEIAKWYRKTGYDFLAIAEHNDRLTKKKIICHDEAAKPPEFIMLCALELSESRHLTALGIEKYVGGETSLQDGVNKTIEAGGIPILNHPREPIVKVTDFIKTKGLNHFEIFNGDNPQDTPACERLWDSILSIPGGRLVYAVASDDNHYKKSKVGRGWIMVDSPSLTKENIEQSIRKGNFYASTGIFLTKLNFDERSVSVVSENGTKISFIGKNGKILKTVNSASASYQIRGDEFYVRVKITNAEGNAAWIQPFIIPHN